MTAWLVFISTCVFETALCIYYYDSFIFFKWGKIQKLISFILLALSVGGNSALFEKIPNEYYSIKLITYIAIHMLFVRICYRSDWIMSVFFSGAAVLLQILTQILVCVPLQLSRSNNPTFLNLMACLSCLIAFCIEFVLRKKLHRVKECLKKEHVMLRSYIWVPLVTMIVGLFFYMFFVSPAGVGIFQGIVSAVLLAVNIFSMFLLQDSLIKDEKLRLSEVQIESKQNQLRAFHDMQSLYERQGRKLHDYKKQLATVEELLKNGDVEAAIEFTEQLTKSIAVEMSEVNAGHPVVNAVLNQFYRIAKSEDIGMVFTISDMCNIRLSDDDIVIVMGNLLENAIHECKKVKTSGRSVSIQVKLVEKDSRIIFTVRNPVVQKVDITDNHVQNGSRDGQGIGLSNVQGVIDKYDGSFAISCDEKEFTAVTIL